MNLANNIINVYIVESPVQVINCIEAANWSNANNNVLFVRYSGREENDKQIKQLIKEFSWSEVVDCSIPKKPNPFKNALAEVKLFNQLARRYQKVNKLFIGEFRSKSMHYLRAALSPDETYLVDDGDITLSIQELYFKLNQYQLGPLQKHMPTGVVQRVKEIVRMILYIQFFKPVMKTVPIHLFTAFDVSAARDQKVVANRFSYFKGMQHHVDLNDQQVFYFGSKYNEAGLLTLEQELSFLKKVQFFFEKKQLQMVYIPHRDDSAVKLKLLESNFGLTVKRLGMPAEIYFIKSSTRPGYIAGACTSAINNLARMNDFNGVYAFALPFEQVPINFREDMYRSYDNFYALKVDVIDFYNQSYFTNRTNII